MAFGGVQFQLIRHAPVATQHIYTGWTDLDCISPSNFNHHECESLILNGAWLTSDLRRSINTARWMCEQLHVSSDCTPISALREQNFGDWEGQPYSDIYAQWPDLNWQEPANLLPPNGECFVDVCERVHAWLDDLLIHAPVQSYSIVAHAGSIRAILAHALNITPQQALFLKIDTGSISKLNYFEPRRGAATIECINRILFISRIKPRGLPRGCSAPPVFLIPVLGWN